MGRALRQFLSALYNRRNSRQQPPIPPPFQRAGRLCISRRAAFFFPAFRAHPPASSRNAHISTVTRASRRPCALCLSHTRPSRHPFSRQGGFAYLAAPPFSRPSISRSSSRIIPKRAYFNRHPRLAPPMRAVSLTYPPIPPSFQRAGRLCISRRAAFSRTPAFRAPPPASSRNAYVSAACPVTRASRRPCVLCLPHPSVSRPSSRHIPKRVCFSRVSHRPRFTPPMRTASPVSPAFPTHSPASSRNAYVSTVTRVLRRPCALRLPHPHFPPILPPHPKRLCFNCVSRHPRRISRAPPAHPAPDAEPLICRTPSLFLHSKRSRRLHARAQNE